MVPSDDYFKNLAEMRPLMENYNLVFIEKFTDYLENQTFDMLTRVFEVRQSEVSRSAGNSYGHINILYKICDISRNEIGVGYVPITNGVLTWEKAVDKYHKLVFMRRRVEFLRGQENTVSEVACISEARDYIISQMISPIALLYIIKNELGGDVQSAISYWEEVYRAAGMEREALLLSAMLQL